jgi:uncharacterized protein (DUF924 family)
MAVIEEYPTVLDLWFSARVRPLWFRSTADFDSELRDRFEATWQAARRGELAHWERGARSALALVIVLDQFPLNIYRGTATAFSTEAQARAVAARAIAQGWDGGLDEAGKTFLYLPFMHSEALADQERAIALYEAAGMVENLRFARHHHEIVRRFGRFPHRNAALGRASSEVERQWLASGEGSHG